MWGQTISPGSLPFKSHMYICCIIYLFSVLFLLFYIVHRKKKSFLFLPKEGPLLQCRIHGTTESVMLAYTHKYAKV